MLPDAPTMAEQGVANFTAYAWQGLVAPAGVPENVVKKLSADLDATLKTPAVSQKMMDMGVIPCRCRRRNSRPMPTRSAPPGRT